jgi:excinuclease UvrABC ATPase subunit
VLTDDDGLPAPRRVEHLLGLLDRLVEAGKSVIVIEHN